MLYCFLSFLFRLGYETTKALVLRDATVILACRSLDNANNAIQNIREITTAGKMIPLAIDLCSFDSIEIFANAIKESYDEFSCLVLNAGLATLEEKYTKEGFEIHFGVNYLGQFLLTYLLKDEIKRNKSRIVIVSSRMHEKGTVDFHNLGKFIFQKGRANTLYNNSKLMNFYFGRELYKQGFDVHILCPGLCKTNLFRNYNPKWYHYVFLSPVALWYLRSAQQGSQNIVFCATDNKNTLLKNPASGYYIKDLQQCKSEYPFSDTISEKLWKQSIFLCKLVRTFKK